VAVDVDEEEYREIIKGLEGSQRGIE